MGPGWSPVLIAVGGAADSCGLLVARVQVLLVFVLGHGCVDALREGRKRLWQEVQHLLFFWTQIMAYQFDLSFVLTF